MNFELLLSFLAFVSSAVSAYLAYLVLKEKKNDDEYKVSIEAKRMTETWPQSNVEIAVIAVSVINKGKRPIKLVNLYAKSFQQEYLVTTDELPRLLTESDDIILRIRLDYLVQEKILIITELGIVDNNKKCWKISSDNITELNKAISNYRYKNIQADYRRSITMARGGFTEQELEALNKNIYVLQFFTVNLRIASYENPQYNFSIKYYIEMFDTF